METTQPPWATDSGKKGFVCLFLCLCLTGFLQVSDGFFLFVCLFVFFLLLATKLQFGVTFPCELPLGHREALTFDTSTPLFIKLFEGTEKSIMFPWLQQSPLAGLGMQERTLPLWKCLRMWYSLGSSYVLQCLKWQICASVTS